MCSFVPTFEKMKTITGHIILLAALLLTLQPSPARRGESSRHIKLLYWNIQNGMWDGQDDNYDKFTTWVASRQPDICVWAEAQTIFNSGTNVKCEPGDRYLTDGWKELARRYGHTYIYVGGHRDNYPQVITSRFPIRNVRRFTDETPDSTVSHGAGWAKIKFGKDELNIVTVHTWPQKFSFEYNRSDSASKCLSASKNEGDLYRVKEVKYICNNTVKTDKTRDGLWLMLGDFNSISSLDNGTYRFPSDSSCFLLHDYILRETPYVDAVRESHPDEFQWTTYRHWRYDYLYMTEALYSKIESIETIYDSYTVPLEVHGLTGFCRPSDHLPIEVVFNTEKL